MALRTSSNKTFGLLLVLASAFMFGSYGIWSRLIGDGFDNFNQAWTRALIIVILMIPILVKTKSFVRIQPQDRKWFFVFGLFTSFTQAPLFYAYNNMDIGSATLLFYVSMMLTMFLFGIIFLSERLDRVKTISLGFAVIGLLTIFQFSLAAAALLAILMAVLNGIASGGEIASSKKLTGEYSGLFVVWISWIVIFSTNAPVSFLLSERQPVPGFNAVWGWHIGYVLASMLGFFLVIQGAKYIEAGVASLIGLFEIVVSIVLAAIIFDEAITLQMTIGALCIVTAAALPNLDVIKRFQKMILR